MDAQRPRATQHTSAPTPSATKSKYVSIIAMHASQNLERTEQPASRPHSAGFSHHPLRYTVGISLLSVLQGEAESHSSQLFREGNTAPDAAEMRAQGGDFRKASPGPDDCWGLQQSTSPDPHQGFNAISCQILLPLVTCHCSEPRRQAPSVLRVYIAQ